MALIYILLLFMVIAAIIAVETKDLLSAVICVGAIGFGGSLMFLLLRAPDIAITQIVVEVLGLIIFVAGVRVFEALPQFGVPVFARLSDTASRAYIDRGLSDTGATNIVTSVYLDYRAYDTLGEATVLFTSIIGATVILRAKSRKLLEDRDT